jgi:hypothetical protein
MPALSKELPASWRRVFQDIRQGAHKAGTLPPTQQLTFEGEESVKCTERGSFYGRLTRAVSKEQSLRGEGFTAKELRAIARSSCSHVNLFKEHDYQFGAIGRLTKAEFNEKDQFLYVYGQFDLTQTRAKDVYAQLRQGTLRHLSVGFVHPPSSQKRLHDTATTNADSGDDDDYDDTSSAPYNSLAEASFVQNPHQPLAEVLECHSKDASGNDSSITFLCGDVEDLSQRRVQTLLEQSRCMSTTPSSSSSPPEQPAAAAAAAAPAAATQPSAQDARRTLLESGFKAEDLKNAAELQGRLAAMLEHNKLVSQQLSAERQARQEAERKAAELNEEVSVIGREYQMANASNLQKALDYLKGEESLKESAPTVEKFFQMAYSDRNNKPLAQFMTHTLEALNNTRTQNQQLQQQVQQLSGTQSAYSEALTAQAAQQAYQSQQQAMLSNFAPGNHPLGASSQPVLTQHAAGAVTVPLSSLPTTTTTTGARAPNRDMVSGLLESVNAARKRIFVDDDAPAPKNAAAALADNSASAPYRIPRGRLPEIPSGL